MPLFIISTTGCKLIKLEELEDLVEYKDVEIDELEVDIQNLRCCF